MIDRKEFPAFRIVLGCAVATLLAGEHLQFASAPAKQMLSIATIASTTSAVATMNLTTFAKLDAPPPIIPPANRHGLLWPSKNPPS